MDLIELKRQVGFLDESVRKLEILLEPGYGGTASELVRLLQDQEARGAKLASRLAAAEARVAELEGLLDAVRKQRQARLAMSIVHGDPKDKGVYEFFAAVWETETLWAALDRERKGGE